MITSRIVAALVLGLALLSAVPPAAAQRRDRDDESELLVEEAKSAMSKKDYHRAGGLLDRALAVAPRRLDLYILRASIFGVEGKYEDGVALLERARQLAPTNVGVLTALGIQLIQVGRPKDGVPMLERMVVSEPARFDAHLALGRYYLKQGLWPDAAKAYAAYFKYRPRALANEDSMHRLAQANALLRSGNPASALGLYQQVLAERKQDELARLGIAWSTAAISCKKASPVFESISDLEAKYPQVSLVRGRCALELGRLDEALGRVERYRKAAPESQQGWILLGDVRSAQNNWKEAEAAYQRVLSSNANDPVIALKLARAERMLGKPDKAAERLRAAGAPRYDADSWTVEYGEALLALKQGDTLRDLVAPWLKTKPGHGTGEFLLGSAFYLRSENSEALPHLELAVKGGEPRASRVLVDVLNTLAAAAVKKNDLDQASRLLEQAVAAGGNALTTRNLGAVSIATGNFDRAIALLQKADDGLELHLLARAYHGAKKYDDARTAYQRAIKTFGKNPHAVLAMRDLANAELAVGREEEAIAVLDQAVAATPAANRKEIEAVRLAAARGAATEAMRTGRYPVAVRLLRAVEKSADGEALTQLRCDLALAATGATQRDLALDLLRGLERSKARCQFVAPADELGIPILIAWNEDSNPTRARRALDRLETLRRRATGVAEPLLRQAGGDIALRAAADAYNSGNIKSSAAFLKIAKTYDKRSPELTHNEAVLDIATGAVDSAISALNSIAGEVPEARVNLGIAWEKKGEPLRALAAWKAASGVRFAHLKDWIEAKERFWGAP